MMVTIGAKQLEMGGRYLTELRDANSLLGDPAALKQRLEEDGYLLIRGFHDREQVLRAREEILQRLQRDGKLAPDTEAAEARIGPDNKGAFWGGVNESFPAFREVVDSPRTMGFFAGLLGGEVITYDYKWLRAIPNGGNTGAHYDIVYMGAGTPNLYTLWTPFGDTPIDMGTLCVLLGSHRWERVIATYGKMDVDRDKTEGWFSKDPIELVDKFGGQWATTSFQAGDAILFGMYTMHASTVNVTPYMRISCDTRYQLASEPADARWVGRNPVYQGPTNVRPMEEARKKWDLV